MRKVFIFIIKIYQILISHYPEVSADSFLLVLTMLLKLLTGMESYMDYICLQEES